ncbi:insulin-degrading enzyme-like 2 [Drosophila miranda]|uniref:insulin-degrading enzyme-like 2 n=1 Tax=Drosophila miranda TaxID=7229 RepID=UPI00143FADB1|nr:insulin-degrading enzyme-like 2 [Drosophila miranda]
MVLAEKANLTYCFMVYDNGLRLFVKGYNEKLHLIVEAIAEGMVSVGATLCEYLLTTCLKMQGESYLELLKCPSQLATDILARVLGENPWPTIDQYKFLKDITMEDFKVFAQKLPQEMYIKALVQGNYTEESAHKVLNSVLSRLKCEPIKDHRLVENSIVKLPQNRPVFCCDTACHHTTTTNITNFYQIGANSLRVEAILDLLNTLFNSPDLYLKKLGEEINGWVHVKNGIVGYTLTVNLKETFEEDSAKQMQNEIEVFRCKVCMIPMQMDAKCFASWVDDLLHWGLALGGT